MWIQLNAWSHNGGLVMKSTGKVQLALERRRLSAARHHFGIFSAWMYAALGGQRTQKENCVRQTQCEGLW